MQNIDDEKRNLMYLVVEDLSKHKLSEEFKHPVDWVGMWLYDYPYTIFCL